MYLTIVCRSIRELIAIRELVIKDDRIKDHYIMEKPDEEHKNQVSQVKISNLGWYDAIVLGYVPGQERYLVMTNDFTLGDVAVRFHISICCVLDTE